MTIYIKYLLAICSSSATKSLPFYLLSIQLLLPVLSIAAAVLVVSLTHWVYRWTNPKCNNGNLPPGSMGWPLLGETLHFFTPCHTWDILPFIKNRMTRYGPIFRTSLLGSRIIVTTDSEFSYTVFQQEGKSIEAWNPQSLSKVFGSQSLGVLHGSLHKHVKNMVLTVFGPQSLKKSLFNEVESLVARNLEGWAGQETVNMNTVVADMVFDFMGEKSIGYDPEKSSENLRENFDAFAQGLISLPFNIPGTAHHKCLQGRKKVMMMLKNMLEARIAKPNLIKNDFFDYVLEELKQNHTILTQEISLELIFGLLFVNFGTTSQAIIIAIKFLTENPRALKELTEENEKIIRQRERPEDGLTWEEYKSMTFTFQFINETLRLGNISLMVFRKAITDIKFKDYTIPSGWVVMVCSSAVHLDPDNYEDPFNFNPWRWEGVDLKSGSKTFMAFGGGQRLCVGADLAKLQIAVFLHCLVTKYRWQLIKGGDIVRTPLLQFPSGFHVQFFEKEKQN